MILMLALFSAFAHAEPSADKLKAARQVVELMDYKAMFNAFLSQCQQPSGTFLDPKAAFKTDPGAFRGLSPQSAYWPEVEEVYRKYQVRVCKYLSAEEFSEYVAAQYASRASLEDLNTSIAFQSSPAGRRMQQASLAVNEAFQAYAQSSLRSVYREAYKETQADLSAIAERYSKEPR
ncbi:MAG: hypothetical protein C0453_03485 [Comamonadaceae bacterium]|nr:hypothetical protein [Comamonadaceae bacterium]